MTTVSINGVEMGSLADFAEKLGAVRTMRVLEGDASELEEAKKRARRFDVVVEGPEFERIMRIPRRPVPDPKTAYAWELARWMTRRLARVAVPYPLRTADQCLFPTQAFAIKELLEEGRLAGPIRVGGGKMLLAYLIFAVLKAKRPLYVLPKSMLKDTQQEVLKYSADWRGPPASKISYLSYQKLSSPSSAEKIVAGKVVKVGILQALRPDVVVLDECQAQSNRSSIGTRRMNAYKEEYPDTIVITLSGSYLRESVNNAAHLFGWSLGENNPLPNDSFEERMRWASAIDEKQGIGARTEFGALLQLMNEDEETRFNETDDPDDQRAIVCEAVGRRILETPGVIGSQDGPLGIPISINARFVSKECAQIEESLRLMIEGDRKEKRKKWTLPDGTLLTDSFAVARVRYTMNCGFYQVQDPPPPKEFVEGRKEWAKLVRMRLAHNGQNIDSEKNLKIAIEEGHFKDLREPLAKWNFLQAEYTRLTGKKEPPSKSLWFSDEVIEQVAEWFDEQGTGIVWVGYIELGARLSRELDIPYFGAGKVDAAGRHITQMKKGERCVASIGACGTGTNLQHFHSKGLWLGSPSEQPLGRTHRPGQEAERVENWLYAPGRVQLERYWKRYGDALRFATPMSQQAQKIVYAESDIPTPDVAECSNQRWMSYRWKVVKKKLDKDEA